MQQNDRVKAEKAILVGLSADCFRPEENATDESLDELEALLETAGGICEAKVLQNRHTPDPHSFIGEGKAQEVRTLSRARARRSLYLTTTSRRPRSARWRS